MLISSGSSPSLGVSNITVRTPRILRGAPSSPAIEKLHLRTSSLYALIPADQGSLGANRKYPPFIVFSSRKHRRVCVALADIIFILLLAPRLSIILVLFIRSGISWRRRTNGRAVRR